MRATFLTLAVLCGFLTSPAMSAEVTVGFDFNRQHGMSTNQFAVWVENEDNVIVRNLFITSFVTAKGGWDIRDDNLMLWAERSGVEEMPKEVYDVFTGATPSASQQMSFAWDCRGHDGRRVAAGRYRVMIEGSMSSAQHVVFRIPVNVGGSAATVFGEPEFIGPGADERTMIENVVITYKP